MTMVCSAPGYKIGARNTCVSRRAGVPMVPISWVEMQCPETKAVEKRKVAKVTAT